MSCDLIGQKIIEDTLIKFRKNDFEHLQPFKEQLKKRLLESPVLHADETGIKIGRKTEWLHVLCDQKFTSLWASDHLGGKAIDEMGETHSDRKSVV